MTMLLLWALRIIVLLLVIRIVLRFLFQARTPSRGGASGAGGPRMRRPPERIGGALVRDPNCGTYITRERAITSGSGAATQYFCSTECRDAFGLKASA